MVFIDCREEVTFDLGSLGPVTGITHQTKVPFNDYQQTDGRFVLKIPSEE